MEEWSRVRGSRREVARDQVRCDRQVVTAVGGAHPAQRSHDGAGTVSAHHPLDPAAASLTEFERQFVEWRLDEERSKLEMLVSSFSNEVHRDQSLPG